MPPSGSLDGDFSGNEEYWIFGYGSLIWKPPPHFDRRIPGFITSYIRRFWQSSIDHRGTPEAPGRVVTLIPRDQWSNLDDEHDSPEDEVTWGIVLEGFANIGVVYRIEKSHAAEVKAYLDHREINGYSVHYVPVYSSVGAGKPAVEKAVVYIGTHDNPAFVGPMKSTDELARHIYKSNGPSGENKDYLYQLAEALRELSPESKDRHVWDLEEKVRELEKTDSERLELANKAEDTSESS